MKNVMALALWPCLFLVAVLTQSRESRADDCAACDKYLALIPQYSLAEQAANIGTLALHAQGDAPGVDQKLADALVRQLKADTRIAPECLKYVLSKVPAGPPVSVVVTGTLGGAPTLFSQSGDYAGGLMGAFQGMLSHYNPCSNAKPADYSGCVAANGPAAYQAFSQRLAQASAQDLITELGGYNFTVTAADVTLLKAYGAAINTGSGAALSAWAAGPGKQLSTDQFLNVTQMLGWTMNAYYGNARADGKGPETHGIVSVDQALASIHNNSMYMIMNQSDPAAATLGSFTTICRDAAVVQAQFLQARGFPNSYTVTYFSNTGSHVDVVTQDPANAQKLYLINWYGRTTREGIDGPQSLYQGSGMGIPDYTTNYVISAPDGHNVVDVPSEMGKFLNLAAGGDPHTYDQLSRPTSSILAATVSPDARGLVQLRAIYGSDGEGAKYTGVATSVRWGQGTRFPGQAGAFLGQQFRPAAVAGRDDNGTVALAFAQVEQHAVTSPVAIAPNVTGVIDVHLAALGALSQVTSGPDYVGGMDLSSSLKNNFNAQGDQRLGVESRIDQTAFGDRIKAQYVAGASAMFGASDVRNIDPGAVTLVPLNAYLGARATLDLGPFSIIGQSMLVVDQLGARNVVEAGVVSRMLAATVYESGRVTHGTALIQDSSIRRVGVSLTVVPAKALRIGLTGETPIEGANPLAAARIIGTAGVTY
ncbi:MAG: hypothetical protein HY074_15720 [Deltaproteobacteria bacterium]|nr:hypothetical protein [Deltaproteobacteria bacterium]